MWVLFEFQGLCGDALVDDNMSAAGLCFAFDLLYFSVSNNNVNSVGGGEAGGWCVFGLCVQLGSLLWGNEFPSYGMAGGVAVGAWGPSFNSQNNIGENYPEVHHYHIC